MKYTIDGCIGFYADDGSLFRIDSNDSVTLPVPAQRLLLLLLESDGEILGREELLVRVWDNYGLSSSGNSLNQYLSLIRRSMSAFGCDTFVETLPKVGIRLHEGVLIEKEASTPAEPERPQPAKDQPAPSIGSSDMFLRRGLFPVAAAFLVSVLVAALLMDDSVLDPHPSVHLLPGGCRLVTFFEPAKGVFRNTEDEVLALLKTTGQECKQDVTLYFDNIAAQSDVAHARTLMAYCENDTKGHDIVCHNFFYASGAGRVKGAMHEK